MFDIKTVPKVSISEGSIKDFHIKKENHKWFLYQNNNQLMCLSTKTLREYKEQYAFFDLAHGNVLMSGWGFGLSPLWIASKIGVESVTVIENNPEVVELFLRDNSIPDNVKIIYGNIKEYKTEDFYDCLFLDHIPDNDLSPLFDEISQIAGNINHKVLWFWSLEHRYIMDELGFSIYDLYIAPKSFKGIDFYSKWKGYVKKYSPTIPDLDAQTVELYVSNYFIRV